MNNHFNLQQPLPETQPRLSSVSASNQTVFNHAPGEARINWKRPRNASPESYSEDDMVICEPALKRLRIVDGHENYALPQPISWMNGHSDPHFQRSFSSDVASLAEESIAQGPQNSFQQHSSLVPLQPHNLRHQSRSKPPLPEASFGQRPRVYGDCQAPSEIHGDARHATDYQPINSVLGDLHMTRRRHRSQALPQNKYHTNGNQIGAQNPLPQQHPITHQHRSTKKVASLRVHSNLY